MALTVTDLVTPPEKISKDWIAERVSLVDLEQIELNIAEARDDISWGLNSIFNSPNLQRHRQTGKGKDFKQINDIENSYVVADDIEVGF